MVGSGNKGGHVVLQSQITIGIDAANIRLGGGITHLAEILNEVDIDALQIQRVIVWSCQKTLNQLPNYPWLEKICPPKLNGSLFDRVFWQVFSLSDAARTMGCDVLLIPGGSYLGDFKPIVTMSQNLLPFEWTEIIRSQSIFITLKMLILRIVQGFSFKRSNGVIFLTQYAKKRVLSILGKIKAPCVVIHHGFNHRFEREPKIQKELSQYSMMNPLNILYVSNIDVYKHQIAVIEAIFRLRQKGLPVSLTLIGPAVPGYLKQLKVTVDRCDPNHEWVRYFGQVPYGELPRHYQDADIGLFASSCETFGIILLEKMSAGLPIACSNKSAMPELLKDAGVYFDPDNILDIELTLERLITQEHLRAEKSVLSFRESKKYQWSKCAQETFTFISEIARKAL